MPHRCSSIANQLRFQPPPSASIEVDEGHLAAEIIDDCGTLGGIHLDLSIDDFEIVCEPAVVPNAGDSRTDSR